MFDIHYPFNHNSKKQALAETCSKNSKDSVNANIYVQHHNSAAQTQQKLQVTTQPATHIP